MAWDGNTMPYYHINYLINQLLEIKTWIQKKFIGILTQD
jgi:hypothetical protein